ncbi:hypothetical protein ACIQWR_06685 [Streptomyces sp. NPDC098789]|uniref:hypothetical protein n=1 Tax=Streptomyces sp. NPDC098789 TaxID=3366098 RepID=UPI00380D285F
MARTAHHRRSLGAALCQDGPAPLTFTVTLYDLRFSARLRAEAERAGRRVRPAHGRHRSATRRLPRLLRDPSVARWAAQDERRARARLRTALRAAVRTAGAGDPDVQPARHRRGALRLA